MEKRKFEIINEKLHERAQEDILDDSLYTNFLGVKELNILGLKWNLYLKLDAINFDKSKTQDQELYWILKDDPDIKRMIKEEKEYDELMNDLKNTGDVILW